MNTFRPLEQAIRHGAQVQAGLLGPLPKDLRASALDAAVELGELDKLLATGLPDLTPPADPAPADLAVDLIADLDGRLEDLIEGLRDWIARRWEAIRSALAMWLIDKYPRLAGWMILEGVIAFDPSGSVPVLDTDRLIEWLRENKPFLSTETVIAAVGDIAPERDASAIVALLAGLVLAPRTLAALHRGSLRLAPLRGAAAMTEDPGLRAVFETHRDWASATFLLHGSGAVPADALDHLPGMPDGRQVTVALRGTSGRDAGGELHANGELWMGVRVEEDEFVHRFAAEDEDPLPDENAPFSKGWVLRIAPMVTFGVGRTMGEWSAALAPLPNRDGTLSEPLAQGAAVEATLSRETAGRDFVFGVPFDSNLSLEDLSFYARIRDEAPVLELGARAEQMSIFVSPRAFRSGLGAKLGDPMRFREGMSFDYELLEFAWLAGVGTRLNIQGRSEAYVVIEQSLGPFTIHGVEIVLPTRVETEETSGAADKKLRELALRAEFHLSLDLGPLMIVASGLGFWAGYHRPRNEEAEYFGLLGPTGLGLEVTLPGVSGGGFVERNARDFADRVEWGGVLDLQVGSVGFTGFALYEQWMGAAEGRPLSFLGILTMRRPIPIFAGIFLEAGSIMFGLHRTIDADEMRRRLLGGALDSLFFPEDPIRQAPVILRDLRAFFPWKQGSHVVGLGVHLSFVKIVSLKLGAAMEIEVDLPDAGPRIGRMVFTGVLATPVVPKVSLVVAADADDVLVIVRKIYQINAHAVGVLDPHAGRFSLDAALVNSKLIGALSLTGDAAIRIDRQADAPHTEITLGGFHPDYDGARGLYPKLQRLGANVDTRLPVTLRIEGYLAFTDSAVMLGGHISATGKIGGFKVKGWVYADLLIEDREKFFFTASIGGGVSVSWKSFDLAKVTVKGTLKGVDPTVLHLRATFEIGWWDKSFDKRFNLTRIAQDFVEERLVSVPEEVIRTFTPQALTAADSTDPDVVAASRTRDPDDPSRLVVHPGAALTWAQGEAPLETDVTRHRGNAVLGGRQVVRAAVAGMTLGEGPRLLFAHDAYLDLSRAERLRAGGFTEHPNGVRLFAEGLLARGEPLPFEETAVEVIEVGTRAAESEPLPPRGAPVTPPAAVRRAALARRGARTDRAPRTPRHSLTDRLYDVRGGSPARIAEALVRARGGAAPVARDAPVLAAAIFEGAP